MSCIELLFLALSLLYTYVDAPTTQFVKVNNALPNLYAWMEESLKNIIFIIIYLPLVHLQHPSTYTLLFKTTLMHMGSGTWYKIFTYGAQTAG